MTKKNGFMEDLRKKIDQMVMRLSSMKNKDYTKKLYELEKSIGIGIGKICLLIKKKFQIKKY